MPFVWPIIILGLIALVFGVALAVAGRKLAVPVDEKEDEVRRFLAGANCGACGYPGCDGFAAALVKGEAKLSDCSVTDADSKKKIGAVLGEDAVSTPQKMVVSCAGGRNCTDKFIYSGRETCKSAVLVHGGQKACAVGCLGFGDCVKACNFGAIFINTDGFAEIDRKKCANCGLCVAACPRGVIASVDNGLSLAASCKNNDKGVSVKKICSSGCLACGLCVKLCKVGAIELFENLPKFDEKKCVNCGVCVDKCPAKSIKRAK